VRQDVYHVDAFADEVFKGNPAVICPLEKWLDDDTMQRIAAENNVSETAFFVKTGDLYHIRWFAPKSEVELCGHATLASAFVIFNYLGETRDEITFAYKEGELIVKKADKGALTLILDAKMPTPDSEYLTLFNATIGEEPIQVLRGLDYILIYESEEVIKKIKPRFDALRSIDLRGICITARGNEKDFVYRFFAPKLGINEDFITGSACKSLAPFWAKVLDKKVLKSTQLSPRGSDIECALMEEDTKVAVTGYAVLYMKGEIYLP
jgi:PhzF family phenazine biosynthesis protein